VPIRFKKIQHCFRKKSTKNSPKNLLFQEKVVILQPQSHEPKRWPVAFCRGISRLLQATNNWG
jgi:hypothetical protein